MNRRQKGRPRRRVSRLERETRARQLLITGTGLVLGLVVLVLGWGLYEQYVLHPRQPVATVAGEPIRRKTYQDTLRYRRWYYGNYLNRLEEQERELLASEESSILIQYIDQQIGRLKRELANLSVSVLEELIDDRLVRQECSRQGIAVSPEKVQLKLEDQFGYARNPPAPAPVTDTLPITITATPTTVPMTEEEFLAQSAAWFRTMYDAAGFGESEYRRMLESMLYRERLEEVIRAGVPAVADQVHARHILLETLEEAEAALVRLRDGEGFEELAAELSGDTATKDQGGDLGWFPREQMAPAFGEAAFALQPGELGGVVETEFGYHIIRVDEREAERELDATARWEAERRAVNDWFAAQRASQDIERHWDTVLASEE